MTSNAARVLIWGWAVALVALSTGFTVYDPGNAAIFVPPALMAVVLGALIVTRVRGNPVGVAMLIGGSSWLIYAIGHDYAVLSTEIGPLPGEYTAAWLGAWAGPLFYLSFPTLLLLFPDGSMIGRRKLLLVVVGGLFLLTLAGGISLWGVEFDILIDAAAQSADPRYQLTDLAFISSLWMAIPTTFVLVRRYRNGSRILRQQVKWLLFGSISLAGSLSLAPMMDGSELWGVALALGMSLFPIGVGVAVFKYRLYDLGRILSRTVSYAIVVAALGAVFVLGVVIVPNQLLLVEDPPALLVATSTLAAAALFNPLRRRVQGWVDRHFNRSTYDTEQVMHQFAGSLRDEVDADDVVDGWVDVVEETMQPAVVGVWVRR